MINAAGYYAKESVMVHSFWGRSIPMSVMSHQYLLTEEIPELQERSEKLNSKLPLLRDVDSSYYLRQEKNGLNLGPYEKTVKFTGMNLMTLCQMTLVSNYILTILND